MPAGRKNRIQTNQLPDCLHPVSMCRPGVGHHPWPMPTSSSGLVSLEALGTVPAVSPVPFPCPGAEEALGLPRLLPLTCRSGEWHQPGRPVSARVRSQQRSRLQPRPAMPPEQAASRCLLILLRPFPCLLLLPALLTGKPPSANIT